MNKLSEHEALYRGKALDKYSKLELIDIVKTLARSLNEDASSWKYLALMDQKEKHYDLKINYGIAPVSFKELGRWIWS